MEQYRYRPLPPIAKFGLTTPFTRLLLLPLSVAHDILTCSPTTVDIQSAPYFEALSYSWSRESTLQPLWYEGRLIPIRPDLDLALRICPYQARAAGH